MPHPGLIAGAGPVGLAAALFLTRNGHPVRIVDPRPHPSRESRALAVNPRTLHLLEPTGVTARMLDIGLKIHGGRFHRDAEEVGRLSLDGVHPTYPFLLALSQSTTERLLERALEAAGGRVERGVKLVGCRSDGATVAAELENAAGTREQVVADWMLAADGAHSTARESLGVPFDGTAMPDPWHLADVPLRTDLPADAAHIFFRPAGEFVFMLRVVDPDLADGSPAPLWRVIGNRKSPVTRLPSAEPAGDPVWSSTFHVAHRTAAAFSKGAVHFAGDAAHVHSPIGARGMNLGIEDAWVFAGLVAAGRLSEYDALRRPTDRRVVRRVEQISRLVGASSAVTRLLRRRVLPVAFEVPAVRREMARTLTGLDHDLPKIA